MSGQTVKQEVKKSSLKENILLNQYLFDCLPSGTNLSTVLQLVYLNGNTSTLSHAEHSWRRHYQWIIPGCIISAHGKFSDLTTQT